MAIKIVAIAGSLSVLVTGGRPFLVGRSTACDLPIQDPTVSRRHAELELTGAGVRVRDLGSTNGTYLDGVRVIDALATPGSRIAFGKVDFKVVAEQPLAQPLPPSEEFSGEGSLDATILRQVPVRGQADIASQLETGPRGASLLRIGGESLEERQARKLNLLLDIAKELSQQTEVDRLLDRVVGLTFEVMDVDRVAIMTGGENGEELVRRLWRTRVESPAGSWRVPRAIARKAVAEKVAVLSENVPEDERFEEGGTGQKVQSALCAPLLGSQGTVLGIIYLDHLANTHSFSEEDLDFFTAFAGMAAVAMENSLLIDRMRREAVVLSNFQRYFAPDLARQIAGQEGEIQLGGAKRQVVVLFSDIRGFTSLSERMSPDEIATLLTDYFTEMVEIVFEHGGTLDKFMGDAMMALWGAPLAGTDDADRAMRAAVAMQRKLTRLNEQWAGQGRPALTIGIGINLGEVFAGNIGSARRLEYTVIGDAVNTAARLCSEAEPGEILIAEPLYAGLTYPPPVSALTPLPLRGKAQPVPVYSVEWRHPAEDEVTGERPVVRE
ncbi:MAG TPA: adenylate/guanylate cyclase domain-containing protein [Thermoanaerobaculia bacterium]|nr:adenylate/guanylate cyclase domain-containing protein [Thermoanaerobaculia bacterium]